jgi:hypothetical protein
VSVLPLVFGVGLFLAVLLPAHPPKGGQPNASAGPSFNLPLALLGFLFIMVGLISGGPWLTKQTARLLARHSSGPSGLLAGRRLADSPATAFRAVSGLVLAVFVATTIGVVAATVNTAQTKTPADTQLSNVLRMNLGPGSNGPPSPAGKSNLKAATTSTPADGLSAHQSASLLHQLAAFPGTTIAPYTTCPAATG